MNIITLERASKLIRDRFGKNPSSSISSMYRNLREDISFSSYGDYVLLSLIVDELTDIGVNITKKSLSYAARQSEELKGQTHVLEALINTQMMQRYLPKIPLKRFSNKRRYKLPASKEKAK